MRQLALISIILCGFVIGCSGGSITTPVLIEGGDVTLLIANSIGETLSLATRVEGIWSVQLDVLPTGQATNDIVLDGTTAYIVCSLSNSIHVVDTEAMTTIREISTGAGTNPFDAELADDGTLWVSLTLANQLIQIDPSLSEPIIRTVDLPGPDQFDDEDPSDENVPWPQGICIVDGKVYVAFTNLNSKFFAGGSGAIGIIDAVTGDILDLITVGGRNTGNVAHFDETPGFLYIISAGDFIGNGLIEIFDLDAGVVVDSLPIEGAPFELVLGPTGAAYVADGLEGDVFRFDYNSLALWPRIDIPESGIGFNFVSGLCLLGGNELAVLEFNGDTLYIVDGITGSIKESFVIGDGPDAIAVLN